MSHENKQAPKGFSTLIYEWNRGGITPSEKKKKSNKWR